MISKFKTKNIVIGIEENEWSKEVTFPNSTLIITANS